MTNREGAGFSTLAVAQGCKAGNTRVEEKDGRGVIGLSGKAINSAEATHRAMADAGNAGNFGDKKKVLTARV